MEVKAWSYEELPEFTEAIEGVKVLPTTGDEMGVRYVHNVEYACVNGTPLHLQILTPFTRNAGPEINTPPTRFYPCVVHVQGSAWMQQNVFRNVPQYAQLARRGYVVAVVEYRHSGIAAYPAQIMDARNAIRFLRVHAAEYGIDPEKIIVEGDSSGGHTAIFTGILGEGAKPTIGLFPESTTAEAIEATNLYPGVSCEVKGIVDFYGSVSVMADDSNPIQVTHCLANSPEGMVMGHVDMTEDMKKVLSAENWITPELDLPPILMFHGTKDRMVNTTGSVKLYQRLKECGKDVTLYLIGGADHGGAEYWTPQVLDIVEEFIQKCLG